MVHQADQPQFLRPFLQLAGVNILSNVLVPIAGLLDVAFLGHLGEIRHLAGVAVANVVFSYLYWSFGFLRMGTTGMTAQASGRGESDALMLIVVRNGLIAIAISSVILLLQVPIRAIGFSILSASPDVKASGQAFYDALIWGAPATLINFVLLGWFLGRAESGKVLWMSVTNNLAGVALDYWLIVRLGWQSSGAGLATALGQYFMLLVGLAFLVQEVSIVQVKSLLPRLFDAAAFRTVFRLNRDILVRTLALISTFAVFTNLSAAFGTEVLTTNTLLLQVVTLAAYFIDGFAFATETFAGTFYAKRSRSQLIRLLCISGLFCVSCGIGIACIFMFNPIVFALLTNHNFILDRVNQFVIWLLPVLGFGSIAYLLDGYFLGLAAGRILRTSTLIAAIAFVPIAIGAWYGKNAHLLWLALSVFMLVRAATLATQIRKTLGVNQLNYLLR